MSHACTALLLGEDLLGLVPYLCEPTGVLRLGLPFTCGGGRAAIGKTGRFGEGPAVDDCLELPQLLASH